MRKAILAQYGKYSERNTDIRWRLEGTLDSNKILKKIH
jgi:hypothetical protein